MPETSFEHSYDVGDKVYLPSGDVLKEGDIDKVIFHKAERHSNSVSYEVHPKGAPSTSTVIRDESNLLPI